MYNLSFLIFFFSPLLSQFRREPESPNPNPASKHWIVWPLEIGYCFTLHWLLCHTPSGKPGNVLPLCLFNRAKSYSTLGCFDISVINQFPHSICSPPYNRNHVISLSVMAQSTRRPLRDPRDFFIPHTQIGVCLIPVESSHVTRKASVGEKLHYGAVNVGQPHFLKMQSEHRRLWCNFLESSGLSIKKKWFWEKRATPR